MLNDSSISSFRGNRVRIEEGIQSVQEEDTSFDLDDEKPVNSRIPWN
jgi:hypothetical protein